MVRYEYRVVPAPVSGLKAKGLKTTSERFAHALQTVMNELGQDGWDYVRADTLPCEERSGLTGRVTKYQNMLVFRRPVAEEEEEPAAVAGLLEAPAPAPTAATAPDPAQDKAAPSPSAPPRGPVEPPLSRFGGEPQRDGDQMSKAARAAAVAFRPFRGSKDAPESDSDDPDSSVAAR